MASPVVQISAYGSHSLALKSDGTIVGWGIDNYGQITIPAGLTDAIAVAAGNRHSLAIKANGTVVGWGLDSSGQSTPTAGLTGVTAISAGDDHSIALKSDGTVVGWGLNTSGQITIPAGLTGVIAISAKKNHSLALKSDGTVVGWGSDSFGQASPPVSLTDATAISAGLLHGLALKSDSTVVGWGNNGSGQITIPAGLTGVIAISCGDAHSLAVKSDGTVVGWGSNGSGESTIPADLTDATAISGGNSYSLALKSAGTVIGWGNDSWGKATPPSSIQPPVDLEINATLSISAIFDNSVSVALSANLDFGASFSGFQDWVSALPPLQLQEVYRLVITGAPDGIADLHVGGISSWQATNQAGGRSSYLQAVIPSAELLMPDIDARQNGELVIQKGYRLAGGATRFEEILRSRFDTLRPDRGQRALTVTVSGYLLKESSSLGARTLTGVRSISSPNGQRRVRCEIDMFLQPGMTAHVLGESFVVDYINYYVNSTDKFCEVSER